MVLKWLWRCRYFLPIAVLWRVQRVLRVLCPLWFATCREIANLCSATFWLANIGTRHQVSNHSLLCQWCMISSINADTFRVFFLVSQVPMERHATARESPVEELCHATIVNCKSCLVILAGIPSIPKVQIHSWQRGTCFTTNTVLCLKGRSKKYLHRWHSWCIIL